MDERQLRILRELGELGSVTAVAEALYVTPSAVSQQLRLLQRSVAVPLTERRHRRLVLTDAGSALAAAAADVETSLARARRVVGDYVADPAATVAIAAFHSAAVAFFPPLVADPDAPTVMLFDHDVAQDEFAALTRRFDVVVAHRLSHSPRWPTSVVVTNLLEEPLDVALPTRHRLARRRTLSPRDVAREPWITVQDGFPVLAIIDAIAAAAGRPLDLRHRINDYTVGIELVAAGAGITLVPRWTVPPHPGVVRIPLARVHAHRHIDALCRPEQIARRAVADVLDRLRVVARDTELSRWSR